MSDTELHRPHRGVSAADRKRTRRSALIEAGLELFGTNASGDVTIDQICKHAHLNKRYFYESFGSARELRDAVVGDLLRKLSTGLFPLIAIGGRHDPEPAINFFVRTVFSDPRIARLLFTDADVGGSPSERAHFIDGAVNLWLAADPETPDDPRLLRRFRLGAYAYSGACGEVMLAALTGKLDCSETEIVEYLVELLAGMRGTFTVP